MDNGIRTREDTVTLLKKYSTLIMLALMLLINVIFTPNFFKIGTLWNIVSQTCSIILTGMGMTVVIATGGIDISVGSVMALSGVVASMLIDDIGVFPAIVAGICVCMISGAIAGFMIGKLKVQAMVVTLALMMGVRGVAQLINDGKIYYINGVNSEIYNSLGSLRIAGFIPIQVIPILAAIAITWFLMEKTIFGRHVQAVGDNPRSARLAGINTGKTLIMSYVYCAIFAAVAGVVTSAKTGAADANTLGNLAELDAIASVAVGGTSMAGGRARVLGTVIGALIMQLINITVNMNNITYEYAQILKAIIIVLAVYIQREKNS
ncbi:MAG: ABC transporter permease [Clostridia bacterium]|nr:ABC transporter permease [Clostridia bacterium]